MGWRVAMNVRVVVAAMLIAAVSAATAAAQAQTTAGAVEGIVGHAVFADDAPIHHFVFGAAAPLRVTERFAIGPEVVRMIGPGDDRDTILAAGAWLDLASPG